MKKFLSLLLVLIMVLSLTACSGTKKAEEAKAWPTRPVNVTVAASAGGSTDIIARLYAEKFQEITGQPMVITNISGASAYVTSKEAEPDGYNFGTVSTAFLTYKHQGKVDFTWSEGYDTAAMFGVNALIGICVRVDSPYETITDLLDAAKADPEGVICGGGSGTPYYWKLAFDQAAGTTIYTAALGDTNELNVALLGGQVDAIVTRQGAVKSYLDSGDFRFLCIAAEERSELAPEIPTCKEYGIDFVFSPEMLAMMAPKGTPIEAREGMNKVFAQMQADPEFRKELLALGQEFLENYTLEQQGEFIDGAYNQSMEVIKAVEG